MRRGKCKYVQYNVNGAVVAVCDVQMSRCEIHQFLTARSLLQCEIVSVILAGRGLEGGRGGEGILTVCYL